MPLKVVFMGTPDFAVPSLAEIISSGYDVVRVYTQPPRRAGRGKQLQKSPVHQCADIMGVPVHTPLSFRKSKIIDELESLDADVACVVAYGQILPKRALAAPRYGSLNLHGSKLPRWRGAAPIQRAIMAGDAVTAAQIIQMGPGLDTGPILLSETVPIQADDTSGSLHERLSHIGAGLWSRALAALQRGGLTPTEQVGTPIYADKIDKSEARIHWDRPANEVVNLIRGLSPFPGAWCDIANKRVKIHMAKAETDIGPDTIAGTVLDEALLIACGTGAIRLLSVQPAGKAAMGAADFLRGSPCPKGTVLS